MKRWQDRGEVQDSENDEESLSFAIESQSPNRPSKRLKTADQDALSQESSFQTTSRQLDVDRRNDPRVSTTDIEIDRSISDEARAFSHVQVSSPSSSFDKHIAADRQLLSSSRKTSPRVKLSLVDQPLCSPTTARRSVRTPTTPLTEISSNLSSPLSVLPRSPSVPLHYSPAKNQGKPSTTSSQRSGNTTSSVVQDNISFPRVREDSITDHGRAMCVQSSPRTQGLVPTRVGKTLDNVPDDADPSLQLDTLLADDEVFQPTTGRNLRTRKKKQLYPYMFDQALYQQQCRERGIKPLRFVDQPQFAASNRHSFFHDNGSQDRDGFVISDSSQVEDTPEANHSPPDAPSNDRNLLVEMFRFNSPSSSDDESLASSATQSFAQRGHTSDRQAESQSPPVTPIRAAQHDHINDDVENIPPISASCSEACIIKKASTRVFKMPLGLENPQRVPPNMSPGPRKRLMNRHDGGKSRSSGQTVDRGFKRNPVLSKDDSSTECSESDAVLPPEQSFDELRLMRERRRVKGVLPASWLRIDMRAQKEKLGKSGSQRALQTLNTPDRQPQKGVATIVPSHRPKATQNKEVLTISDDDSDMDMSSVGSTSKVASPLIARYQTPGNSSFRHNGRTDIDDDSMELDWIDPMLAGTTRPPRNHKRTRASRQPRIDSMLEKARAKDIHEKRPFTMRSQRADARRQKNRSPQGRAGISRRKSKTSLSVVDALEWSTTRDDVLPQFVAIALRQARKQPNCGRHSPTDKHFRMSTHEETEDINNTLTCWEQGLIQRVLKGLSDQRSRAKSSTRSYGGEDVRRQNLIDRTFSIQTPTSLAQRVLPPPTGVEKQNLSAIPRPTLKLRRTRQRQSKLSYSPIGKDEIVPNLRPSASIGNNTAEQVRVVQKIGKGPNITHYRQGQLEHLETAFDREHRAAGFARRMQCLTERFVSTEIVRGGHGWSWDRDLSEEWIAAETCEAQDLVAETNVKSKSVEAAHALQVPLRSRKRLPRRIDADARIYRQPSEPIPEEQSVEQQQQDEVITSDKLQGLGTYGAKYPITFDIAPLHPGTYFHESSFIGSGDFAASLMSTCRELSQPTGQIRIHLNDTILQFGPWTQEVATGLMSVLQAVEQAVDSVPESLNVPDGLIQPSMHDTTIDYLLRSTIRYFSNCLSFIDHADRPDCIIFICRTVDKLLHISTGNHDASSPRRDACIRCVQYAIILARQAYALACDVSTSVSTQKQCREKLLYSAHRLLELQPALFPELRTFYEKNRQALDREAGVRDHDVAVCSIVILHHALLLNKGESMFWNVVSKRFNRDDLSLRSILTLDRLWYDILSVLPLLEFDETGIARPGLRLQACDDDSRLLQRLIAVPLELYPATSLVPGSTINDYIRATFSRLHNLVTTWGWWRCEGILTIIFDFFARQGLRLLRHENSHSSPEFLSNLTRQPSLTIDARDCSFACFLKVLASSLSGIRKYGIYPDKKIGSIAWRFIPNHGRTCRKEDDVSQDDIDALRNHHDLLCTLYFATPTGQRPRVELLRNLVDHSISHREACRLSVKAWSDLASFQASTGEPLNLMDPFCLWYEEILTTTIGQYRLARTEVEAQLGSLVARSTENISYNVAEATITQNQRQIVATLVDALAALKRGLLSARNLETAVHLLRGCKLWLAYDFFDPSEQLLSRMLDSALDTTRAALDVEQNHSSSSLVQNSADDSQGFGDSSALEEFIGTQMQSAQESPSVCLVLHEMFGRLISNIFGADASTDDVLLTKVVDVWVAIARQMVENHQKDWESYLSGYASSAWTQLRSTRQKQRLTPFFIARILKYGHNEIAATDVLGYWIESLVEREGMLKYQHLLTTVVLNKYEDEELLTNLPFVRHVRSGQYDVSYTDLRERRIALIRSVLSNMRDAFENTLRIRPQEVKDARMKYANLLQRMMSAMKKNYLEVQEHTTTKKPDTNSQGTYVSFVHQIISFLQEHTTTIHPIDTFFTDSSAFPLPSTDPLYVVGKLRSYASKLAETGTQKRLLSFFHTLCERAAVDGKQEYLIDQLMIAMSGSVEKGDTRIPSLRYFVCTTIFPAYVEIITEVPTAWIMALPVIDAWGKIVQQLLYDTNMDDKMSIEAACSVSAAFIASLCVPLQSALLHPRRSIGVRVRRTLTMIFGALHSCMTTVEYLSSMCDEDRVLRQQYGLVVELASQIATSVGGALSNEYPCMMLGDKMELPATTWLEMRSYTAGEVRRWISNDIYVQNDRYFLRKNNTIREIIVQPLDEDAERQKLFESIDGLLYGYEVIFANQFRKTASSTAKNDCYAIVESEELVV